MVPALASHHSHGELQTTFKPKSNENSFELRIASACTSVRYKLVLLNTYYHKRRVHYQKRLGRPHLVM